MSSPDETITPAALSAALRATGTIDGATSVRLCVPAAHGAGQLADSQRVELEVAGGEGPRSVFVKLPPSDPASAETASRIGAFERERYFYAELLPRLDVRTPRYLGSLPTPDGGEAVVLEDLSGSTSPLDQLVDGTVEQVASAASQLAGLQAPLWDDEVAAGGANRFYNRTTDHIVGLSERYATSWERCGARVSDGMTSEQISMVESFGAVIVDWAATITGPRTLVHQDLRLDNLLWGDEGAWLVDWQTLAWGSPAWDLSFLMGSALEPEDRRAAERDLVRRHVEALAARGVEGWDLDQAWTEHRRLGGACLLAMLAAVAFVRPTERGFRMFGSMIRRGAQQAIDLDVLSFV